MSVVNGVCTSVLEIHKFQDRKENEREAEPEGKKTGRDWC